LTISGFPLVLPDGVFAVLRKAPVRLFLRKAIFGYAQGGVNLLYGRLWLFSFLYCLPQTARPSAHSLVS
jgi:hypothetical protein